ncbi:MAG: protocatechuate 3,4-dioxygenase subunit beta [Actinomycetota bacterium]
MRSPEGSGDDPVVDPPYLHPKYRSTVLRAPARPLTVLPRSLTETTGPLLGEGRVGELDHDLTRQHPDEPQGQRIIVHGRVLGGDGRPVRNTLVEVWQANAAGRYAHPEDTHPAPLDPNFKGAGRALTDDQGRYRFVTVKPGAYPWKNHANAWRPAHIHFSLFGRSFGERLITQMYFPDDPLFSQDPIFNSIPDPKVRERLVSSYDHAETVPEWAMAFRWDIVLGSVGATPLENEDDDG